MGFTTDFAEKREDEVLIFGRGMTLRDGVLEGELVQRYQNQII